MGDNKKSSYMGNPEQFKEAEVKIESSQAGGFLFKGKICMRKEGRVIFRRLDKVISRTEEGR